MLDIIAFMLDLVDRYVIWVYVACLLGIILNLYRYTQARAARANTIFTVEREAAAHREGRAMSNVGLLLGLTAVVLVLQFYVLPAVDTSELVQATTTPAQDEPTATPRPTLAPTSAAVDGPPTLTRQPVTPTAEPTFTPAVTATPVTPTPPPSSCADPNTCITSPGASAVLSGMVAIRGSAQHPNFQFYKIEYGLGEDPAGWNSIGETVGHPVENGTLMTFDSAALPNGVYWLRLTVVDITGNFPNPHRVRVVIEN
ncbi:MAG: hypothetical protein GXX94_05010 [Chloroflexi bacterium]|nr:hypothetical protein [Chloroflexota bacterium]